MKIGGKEIKGPNVEILVLPRGEDEIVIKAQALADIDEFNKLCPEPKPPGRRTKNGFEPQLNDPTYRTLLDAHNNQRIAYMVIRSLEPSQIEWETVDINNPSTWMNYVSDFRKGGLSSVEISRVIQCVMRANALDEAKLEEARKVFLIGQAQEQEMSSGPTTEQGNM